MLALSLFIYQDNTITDPIGKANVLAKYFSSVFIHDNTLPRMSGPDVSPIRVCSIVT